MMNEYAGVVKGITDEASAKAALPRLNELADKMADNEKRRKAPPKPTPKESKAWMVDYSAAMNEQSSALNTIAVKHEVKAVIADALNKFHRAMP